MVSGHAADVNPLRRHWQSSSFNLSSDLSKLNDQLDSIFSDEKEFKQAIILILITVNFKNALAGVFVLKKTSLRK